MGNPSREAWDALTEADFIHSCDCIVCKSLRDDSCHACSGCAVHHVANKAFRARIALLEKVAEKACNVIGDHDERVDMYGQMELQVHRKLVMDQLRAAIDAAKEG